MQLIQEEIKTGGKTPTHEIIKEQRKQQLDGFRRILGILRSANHQIAQPAKNGPAEPRSWARGL